MTYAETTQLSYLPQKLTLQQDGGVRYLFEASGLTLPLYFSMKGKHHYQLANEGAFLQAVAAAVREEAQHWDALVFPQSRYPFLRKVLEGLGNAVELKKRNKTDICLQTLGAAGWNREARQSQERAWLDMGDVFALNQIKSNQRKHYVPHLFEPVEFSPGTRLLLLDDFIVSGTTIAAMRAAVGCDAKDVLGIFSQPGVPI
jgi:hypothetical protein